MLVMGKELVREGTTGTGEATSTEELSKELYRSKTIGSGRIGKVVLQENMEGTEKSCVMAR